MNYFLWSNAATIQCITSTPIITVLSFEKESLISSSEWVYLVNGGNSFGPLTTPIFMPLVTCGSSSNLLLLLLLLLLFAAGATLCHTLIAEEEQQTKSWLVYSLNLYSVTLFS